MFIGLMNSIDQWRLMYNQAKLRTVKRRIDVATIRRDNFVAARGSLCQCKNAGVASNFVYCNKMWVGPEQVDGLIEKAVTLINELTHVKYEKHGTKCAALRRRIDARDAKIAGRQLSGSSIV